MAWSDISTLWGSLWQAFWLMEKKNVEFQSKKNVRFSMFKENCIVGLLLKHYLLLPTNHCAVLYAWTENIAPTHCRKTHNLTNKTLKSLNFCWFRINITLIYNRNLKEERESWNKREFYFDHLLCGVFFPIISPLQTNPSC